MREQTIKAQELQKNDNAGFYSGHYQHYAYTKPSLEFKVAVSFSSTV